MHIASMLALVVCLAVSAAAAPRAVQLPASVLSALSTQAIANLQAQLDNTTNPAMQMLIQQAIDKIKQQFGKNAHTPYTIDHTPHLQPFMYRMHIYAHEGCIFS